MDQNLTPLIEQGWKFSEFFQWVTLTDREQFITMLGEDNLLILDEKYSKNKWKGKLLISPTGLQILNLFMMPVMGTA